MEYYRIYTKDKNGDKFYFVASEGQYDLSKLILKSYKKTKNDINSIFILENMSENRYKIKSMNNLYWTVNVGRGTSSTRYRKSNIPFTPSSISDINIPMSDDPEEVEEEEEEAVEEAESLMEQFMFTEQYYKLMNKVFDSIKISKNVLSVQDKIIKAMKDNLKEGHITYEGDGGPNLYLTKKTDSVPNKSPFFDFKIIKLGDKVLISCYNYETGILDNLVKVESVEDFSNVYSSHFTQKDYSSQPELTFYLEKTELPTVPNNAPIPGEYNIQDIKTGLFINVIDSKVSMKTTPFKLEVSYISDRMAIKSDEGYLTFIKWRDIPKKSCADHFIRYDASSVWRVLILGEIKLKYKYPTEANDDFVWCNSNKNIREDLIKYNTPEIIISKTLEDGILGKNSTFSIKDIKDDSLKLSPAYWEDYALRVNPFDNEKLIIRMCNIDRFKFIPIKKETFLVNKKGTKVLLIVLLIIFLLLILFTYFYKK
jgi:hypothetical protein